MRTILQINKFAYLQNNNIFFCKTDFISEIFKLLKDKDEDCTLITGNSDFEINDQVLLNAPKCIKRWFAQNANTTAHFVSGLPIGIENNKHCIIYGHGHGWEHATQKVQLLQNPPIFDADKNIYANFSIDTHHTRKEIANICLSIKSITNDISLSHNQINKKSYSKYANDIVQHRMTVCPRGNGIDCHRVWEVLYLGRVPIVKKETAMLHFKKLPILFLDDWEQLKDLSFIESEYESVKNNSKRMLDVDFWNNKILFNE